MSSIQNKLSGVTVCSEEELETLLRLSEEHCKSKRAVALKPNSLKVVPPLAPRRDSSA